MILAKEKLPKMLFANIKCQQRVQKCKTMQKEVNLCKPIPSSMSRASTRNFPTTKKNLSYLTQHQFEHSPGRMGFAGRAEWLGQNHAVGHHGRHRPPHDRQSLYARTGNQQYARGGATGALSQPANRHHLPVLFFLISSLTALENVAVPLFIGKTNATLWIKPRICWRRWVFRIA